MVSVFKRCVITDTISQDLDRVIEVCHEFGLDGLELRTVWGKALHDLSDGEARRLKAMADDAGLKVLALAVPLFKCQIGDPEAYATQINNLRRYAELCHVWDCGIIRSMTFYRTVPPEEVWQQLLDAFVEPLQIVEEHDLLLAVENEPFQLLPTAAHAERLYRDLNHPRALAAWDVGNEGYCGEVPFPDAWERVKPWVIHVHIKDVVKDATVAGGAVCVPIGEGDIIDFPGQFRALIEMGYEGACSLETFWRPSEERAEELRRRSGWEDVTDPGELAARLCLANINEIVAGVLAER
jgi:L-ribulose-5-phosphate 3-epimerase